MSNINGFPHILYQTDYYIATEKKYFFSIKHKNVSEGLSFTTFSLFNTTFKDLMFIFEIRIQLRKKRLDSTISIESETKKV